MAKQAEIQQAGATAVETQETGLLDQIVEQILLDPGHRQHERIRRSVRMRFPSQRRLVAAHRTPLRLEFHTSLIWGQPQRAYNKTSRSRHGVEYRLFLEWRRVWHR